MRDNDIRMGAIILDRLYPDWFKVIDLDRFDISSISKCILGQLGKHWEDNEILELHPGYTGYDKIYSWLVSRFDEHYMPKSNLDPHAQAFRMIARLGFCPSPSYMRESNIEWKNQILYRKEYSVV